jgi:Glycosyl transferases group 1
VSACDRRAHLPRLRLPVPYTVGGAERWYRNLAERLAAEGHEVAFLTRRQWDRGAQGRQRRPVRAAACALGRASARSASPACTLPPAHRGLRGEVTVLEGEYAGPLEPRPGAEPRAPLAVFAARHIAEKRVPALVPALARARESVPDLRAEILGDGPDRPAVERAIAAAGLEDAIGVPGFVAADRVDAALGYGEMTVLPSRREGYGMVVIEAAARGTPSVVVAASDNAATELIEEGVNGVVAASADPEELADAMVRVHEGRNATSRQNRRLVRAQRGACPWPPRSTMCRPSTSARTHDVSGAEGGSRVSWD